MSNNRYSILIIDDHPIVSNYLKELIHAHEDASCTIANTLKELNSILAEMNFDLCITDLEIPGISALDLIRTIHKSLPQCRILIYTMHEEPWIAIKLCDADIHPFIFGALSKQADTDNQKRDGEIPKHSYELSETEKRTLTLINQGLNTNQIAERLHISQNTVQTHRKKLLEKMDAKNVAELVYKCKGLFNEELNA